jgi:hypothetical protein
MLMIEAETKGSGNGTPAISEANPETEIRAFWEDRGPLDVNAYGN